MSFAPSTVLQKGLAFFDIEVATSRRKLPSLEKEFKKHFGASTIALADQWHDIVISSKPEDRLEGKKGTKGFTMFLAAHHFLWGYPDNSESLARRFRINEKYARGEHLWKWIRKIAALKKKKIVWPKRFDTDNSEIFIITMDGTDCPIWEPKHPHLPVDKSYYSKKKNRAGLKYLLAISVYDAKVVFMDGPFKAGSELGMFRHKLKGMIRPGKKVLCDGGFPPKSESEMNMLALPHPGYGGQAFRNFKSRARLRHETFNKLLKCYDCLSNIFRHGIEKHKIAFEAICITCQYVMDNGDPIYDAVHHDVEFGQPRPPEARRQSKASKTS